MVLLVRELNRGLWADAKESAWWVSGGCPADVLASFGKPHDISMWRVSDHNEVLRVLAAKSAGQKSIADIIYVLAVEEDLLALPGLKIANTPKEYTPDPDTNSRHVSVEVRTSSSLIELARYIRKLTVYSKIRTDIENEILTRFKSGEFSHDIFVRLQNNLVQPQPDIPLLRYFHKRNAFRIS